MPDEEDEPKQEPKPAGNIKPVPTKRGAPIRREVTRTPQRARKNTEKRGDQGKHK
jgi:hypothetical protein